MSEVKAIHEFESVTGKIIIDISKCVAPHCDFACVKACRNIGRGLLKIENAKPTLRSTTDKRLCNECLSCEFECHAHAKAIRIELPIPDLKEFMSKYWG